MNGDQTPEEIQARLTNYEEGILDLINGIQGGSMTTETALVMLKTLLDAPGQEHLKALRLHEQKVQALMSFKDWCIRELTKASCIICGGTGGTHNVGCVINDALHVRMLSDQEFTTTLLGDYQDLRTAVGSFLATVPEEGNPQEIQDLQKAFREAQLLS